MRTTAVAVCLLLPSPPALSAQGALPPTTDARTVAPPSVSLTAGGTCPLVLGTDASRPPEGLLEIYSATRMVDGKLVRTAAGQGGGPGELSSMLPMLFPFRSDSLLVFESQSGRVHIYDSRANFARTSRIEPEEGWLQTPPLGSTRSGSLVSMRRPRRPPRPNGAWRDSAALIWHSSLGAHTTNTALLEGVMLARESSSVPLESSGGRQSFRTTMRMVVAGPVARTQPPMGTASAAVAVGGDWVYRFDEVQDALVIHDSTGAERRRVLLPPLPPAQRPASDRIRVAMEAQLLELRADRLGRAWVEMPRAALGGSREWSVFDADGRWVARATTPANPDVLLEIGGDYLLLRRADADGVQTVVQCTLVRR